GVGGGGERAADRRVARPGDGDLAVGGADHRANGQSRARRSGRVVRNSQRTSGGEQQAAGGGTAQVDALGGGDAGADGDAGHAGERLPAAGGQVVAVGRVGERERLGLDAAVDVN